MKTHIATVVSRLRLSAACWLIPLTILASTRAGEPPAKISAEQAQPLIYRQYSPSGRYYIEMFPAPVNHPFGRVQRLREDRLLWYVEWYSEAVFLDDDGKTLIRLGNSGTQEDGKEPLGIAFYREGKEFRRYSVAELFQAKEYRDQDKKDKTASADSAWLANISGIWESEFRITLVDGTSLAFDIESGKMVRRAAGTKRLPAIVPTCDGLEQTRRARQVAAGMHDLAFSLQPLLRQDRKAVNEVLSPLDLTSGLLLLGSAAAGDTEREIRKLLYLPLETTESTLLRPLQDLHRALGVLPPEDLAAEISFVIWVEPRKGGKLVVEYVSGPLVEQGLRPGDEILTVGGRKVASRDQFFSLLQQATHSLDLVVTGPDARPRKLRVPIPSVLLQSRPTLWLDRRETPAPEFADALREVPSAALRLLDLCDTKEAATRINAELARETRGLIPELISPLDFKDRSTLVSTSATFLTARWPSPLDRQEGVLFHVGPRQAVKTTMVTGEGKHRLLRQTTFDLFELDYHGGRFSFLILMPDPALTFADVEDTLNGPRFRELLTELDAEPRRKIAYRFPSFRINGASYPLVEPLRKRGVQTLFTPAPDWSRLGTTRKLALARVRHQAAIAVDEFGTTAAAATGIVAGPVGVEAPGLQFTVDHPFLFFVRDRSTNSLLFMGRVVDPS